MKPVICAISVVVSLVLLFGGSSVISLAQEQSKSTSSEKFDEFGNISCEDELARLDNFAYHLRSASNLQGHVIVYGGRRGRRNEAKARAARMKYYLVRIRGLDPKRVITSDGGFREELSGELWIVRPGEPAPESTPTLSRKDVKIRGRVKVRGYSCGAGLG